MAWSHPAEYKWARLMTISLAFRVNPHQSVSKIAIICSLQEIYRHILFHLYMNVRSYLLLEILLYVQILCDLVCTPVLSIAALETNKRFYLRRYIQVICI